MKRSLEQIKEISQCLKCGSKDISVRETYETVMYAKLNLDGTIDVNKVILKQEKDGWVNCRCYRCYKEWHVEIDEPMPVTTA